MSTIFNKFVSGIPGLYVKSRSKYHDAVIAFDKVNTAPTSSSTTNAMLYVSSSGKLTFAYNGVDTIIGAPGAAATTWEAIYANDATMALTSAAWTISQSAAAGNLVLNKTNVGAGAVLTIANSGSGNDITGPAWSLISTGSVGILELTSGGTINASGGALTIGAAGTATTLAGTLTVDQTATITGAVTLTASATITGSDGSNVLTLTAGDAVLSNGSVTVTDTDNAASLAVINNTATTIGAASASGVVEFSSTSLTTGTLLHLELTEGTLNGGYYLRCWDVTGGAAVFSIAENGDTVLTGTAGSNALTLTNGDVLMSDGSLTITDADDAASLSVTNDTATTASVFVLAGAGAFTGSTTTSFLTVTPSGLTTGTAVYLPLAAMTTGKGLHVAVGSTQTTGTAVSIVSTGTVVTSGSLLSLVADSATTAGASAGQGLVTLSADGLTTGTGVDVTSTSIVLTTGSLMNLSHISGNITGTLNCTSTGLLAVDAYRTVTTGTVADDYDLGSFIRTQVINGAGAFTATGSVLYVKNVTTNTSGTITDTVKGIEVVMDADGTGDGVSITHSDATSAKCLNITSSGTTSAGVLAITANALTTGSGIILTANGLTTGTGMTITSSGTITTTGELLSLVGNSATTCTGLLRISGTALTDGFVAEFTGGGANATASGGVLNLNMGAATAGTGLKIVTTGVYTGTTGALAVTASSATTGLVAVITANGLTTGSALLVTSSGTLTSSGEGLVNINASGATTGTALKIDMTEDTLAGGYYIQCYDDSATAAVFTVGENGAVVIAGSAAETDALTVTAGDLSLTSGLINLESGTATAVGNAATLSKATGEIQSSTSNLAASTLETLTITNTRCSTSSHVIAWVSSKGTGGQVCVVNTVAGAGSFTVDVKNIDASNPMSSVYKISFLIINR